jgi:hypothetical protein
MFDPELVCVLRIPISSSSFKQLLDSATLTTTSSPTAAATASPSQALKMYKSDHMDEFCTRGNGQEQSREPVHSLHDQNKFNIERITAFMRWTSLQELVFTVLPVGNYQQGTTSRILPIGYYQQGTSSRTLPAG